MPLHCKGWSLIGEQKPEGKTFFISWDGATEAEGPFAFQLRQKKTNVMHRKNNGVCLASGVMPLMSYVSYTEKFANNQTMSRETRANGGTLPFAKPYSLPFFIQNEEGGFPADYAMTLSCSATLKESIKSAVEIEGGIDDMLLKGLESISRPPMDDQVKIIQSGRPNRSRSLAMSHAEKSKRLLRHCSSWTQLDDTRANRGIVNGQGE